MIKIPKITFKTRVGDLTESGECNFESGKWVDVTSANLFDNKRVVLFSLPGAFTPTCTSQQLPGYESSAKVFKISHNIDEVYCVSVNDSFVMNASWRYAAIINDGEIEKMFVEPGKEINDSSDPYGVSSPENVLSYLQVKEIKESV